MPPKNIVELILVGALSVTTEAFIARAKRTCLPRSISTTRRYVGAIANGSAELDPEDDDDNNSSNNNNGNASKNNPFDPVVPVGKSFVPPATPFGPTGAVPSKADVYDEQELTTLLQMHNDLAPRMQKANAPVDDKIVVDDGVGPVDLPTPVGDSLHDAVLKTLAGIKGSDSKEPQPNTSEDSGRKPPNNGKVDQKTLDSIRAVATDIDATVMASDQSIHPRTKQAIQNAMESAQSSKGKLDFFFTASGKTQTGVVDSLGPETGDRLRDFPGVYIQGLHCLIGDKVVFEKKLSKDAVQGAAKLAKETNCILLAFDGDRLYTEEMNDRVVEIHEQFKDPLAEEVDSIPDQPSIHKLLLVQDDHDKVDDVRSRLEELGSKTDSRVTQAVPGMLELLPEGCSKGLGIKKICEALGIDPSTELLAIGDAENDVEMLKTAAVGVAVGNADDVAKDAADIVLDETVDEGGAGAAIELLGDLN